MFDLVYKFFCRFQSETYEVWDTIFAIEGTSATGNWNLSANVSVAYSNEGTHFTANGTGGNQVTLYRNNTSHSFDGTTDKIYEFDLRTASGMALYLVDNSASRRLVQQNPIVNTWLHIKWEYDSTNKTVTPYIDGVMGTTADLSAYNLTTIGLQLYDWQGDMDCWIKNLKVYNG